MIASGLSCINSNGRPVTADTNSTATQGAPLRLPWRLNTPNAWPLWAMPSNMRGIAARELLRVLQVAVIAAVTSNTCPASPNTVVANR
ncbi:hypothetical protein D3C85_1301080 [compost metagenome]